MRNKKEQAENFEYKSKSTGEFVQAHQYIAELVVERNAAKNKTQLPYKYWTLNDEWTKEYKKQVQHAAKLLKKYSPKAIINALNELFWCYSLFTKKLLELIELEQSKIDLQKNTTTDIKINSNTENFRQNKNKTGLLGKINGRRQEEKREEEKS